MPKVNGVDLEPVAYATADGLARIYQTDDGKFRVAAEDHLDQPAGDTLAEAMAALAVKHAAAKAVRASRIAAGKVFPQAAKRGFSPQ